MSVAEDTLATRPQYQPRHMLVTAGFVIVGVLLLVALGKGLSIDPHHIPTTFLNKKANPFNVSWLQGQEFLGGGKSSQFTLADFKGQPMVLNFWASWCVSCREEALYFEEFWQRQKDNVKVVGIAIQDSPEDARRFAKIFGKTYILGLDEDGKAAIDYGVTGVPETFFIDRYGVIRHKETGPVTTAMLEKYLPIITK